MQFYRPTVTLFVYNIIVKYFAIRLTKVVNVFQIGRSSESPIDFVVMDTIAGEKLKDSKVEQSTISRFACRILADRSNPRVARIYAAGFDGSSNIFLGVTTHFLFYFLVKHLLKLSSFFLCVNMSGPSF